MSTRISRQMIGLVLAGILVMGVSGCENSTQIKDPAPANQLLVQAYTEAYNAHDLADMSANMHPDIEWINIEGSTQQIITGDKQALVKELTGYFGSDPSSISTLSDWRVNGSYVSVKETVTFTRKDSTQGSQASLAVYEIEDGLIRRVWYFPAE